jgi:hypothetical protein
MQFGPFVLVDWSLEHPAISQGTKEELQIQLEKLVKKDPEHPERYEIMPYDVYERAIGFDERF